MSSTVQRLASALAVLAVAVGLDPVISGSAWLLDIVIVVAVVSAVGLGLATLQARRVVVAGAQVAASVLALTVVHLPADAVWGLLPGPAAWRQGALHLAGAVEVVQTQAAPVDADEGLRLVLSAGAGVLVVLVDVLAVGARRPALAGLPLLAVHAVAIVFTPGGLGVVAFLVAVGGFLVLLAAGREDARGWGVLVAARGASTGGVPALAALSVMVAVLAALVVPGVADLRARPSLFTGGGGGGGTGSTTYLNPLLDLRKDLSPREDTVVLRYTTDQQRPQPLRVVTVDTYTGDVWEPGPVEDATPLEPGQALPAAPGTTASTPTTEHTMTITVEALRQQWLPLPYPVQQVDVEGGWEVDPDSRNVIATGDGRTSAGQQYEVDYQQVDPDPAQLAAAPPPPAEVVQRYTELPEGLPVVIAQTAAEVTAGQTTAFEQAAALQEWFRGRGGFRYTLSAPEPESGSALADFLVTKEGYCVQFASTMAVMARTLGIPARVAVGFLPGTRAGGGEWEVSVADAHAWPELYFEGAGWVRFEPTPGSRTGQAPAWTRQDLPADTTTEQVPGAATTPSPVPSTPPAQSRDQGQGATGTGEGGAPVAWGTVVLMVVGVTGAGGLLLSPRAARAVLSWRRWRRCVDDADRAEAAWADLVEQLGDLGVQLPASATPRQVGRRLSEPDASSGSTTEPARVRRLVDAVERSRYGAAAPASARRTSGAVQVLERPVPRESVDLRGDVRAVVADLADRATPRCARRWRWWPPSGVRGISAAVRQARPRSHPSRLLRRRRG